jgi:hypothetical protein
MLKYALFSLFFGLNLLMTAYLSPFETLYRLELSLNLLFESLNCV